MSATHHTSLHSFSDIAAVLLLGPRGAWLLAAAAAAAAAAASVWISCLTWWTAAERVRRAFFERQN